MDITNSGKVAVTFADGVQKLVDRGTTLLDLSRDYEKYYSSTIMAARVDNDIRELTFQLENDCRIQFIDMTDSDGMRIYQRSLYFVLIKAVNDIFPERKVTISHSISKGIYCEIEGLSELTEEEVVIIESRMRDLVNARIPFVKKMLPVEEAKNVLVKSGRLDRLNAVEHRIKPYITIYSCGDVDDYFYGYMAPHTGYVPLFSLKFYKPGLIMKYPDKTNPHVIPEFLEQKKLFNIISEYKQWGRILGVENVGDLNKIVKDGKIGDQIRISEALHEKKIAQIADMITHSEDRKRVVLISGPSSSGKTTFAHRLSIQLRVNGLRPVTISLDDYFVDRDRTPLDEDGELDFEALESIDVPLFNHHLGCLIQGMEVEIPIYNFPKGCREPAGRKLRIDDDQILVIEGIHGLNEKLTMEVDKKNKFKVYVSALTSMNIDHHNRIPSTDTRKIRRIVRDFQFRGCSALSTIKRWPSVRRGEKKNIFPFQEEADVMFNSSLMYELGALKKLAEPILSEIDSSQPEYAEAKRLIEFLSYFLTIEWKEIPLNSIIREFVGGSVFY